MKSAQLQLLQHSCGLLDAREPVWPTADVDDLARAVRLTRSILGCCTNRSSCEVPSRQQLRNRCRARCGVILHARGAPRSGGRQWLVAGAASLLIFGQYNLTGPFYDGAPLSPLDLFAPPEIAKHLAAAPPQPSPALTAASITAITIGGGNGGASAAAFSALTPIPAPAPAAAAEDDDVAAVGNGSGATPLSDGLGGLGVDSISRGDRWAQEQLQLDGEDFLGRCPAVQWLLLARTLLLGPLGAATPSPDPPLHHHPPHHHHQQQQGQGGVREGGEQEAAPCEGVKTATITAAATAAGACLPLPLLAPLLRVTSPACHNDNHHHVGDDSTATDTSTAAVCSWTWSWPWWALRCVMSQQHVLEGRSTLCFRKPGR
ncbi:hypothetical protein VaNZ11_010184 [Volvox africanus]|uniref:Uncharacterized protein n=1 Tax=Volvox africanus TaxID=51714 RepID=A0ABQ5S900_9CHLO|nr:hypothetical protein VaNZ11_010184 [Volvox africanus]